MKVTRKAGKIEAVKLAVIGLENSSGQIGWFESAKYDDGKPVAGVAYVQEFGSTKRSIPPRPFFRTTVTEKQNEWARVAAQVSRKVMTGAIPADGVAEALALKAEGDVRRTISKIVAPPLSYITLLARKYRQDESKRIKKGMKYGPVQHGARITGKTIGDFARQVDQGPPNLAGVSTKPLVDSGLLLATLSSQVLKK